MSFKFNGHTIKAITIKQPWANLIVMGIKDIENRSWSRKMNKDVCKNWLLVHASAKALSKKELEGEKLCIKYELDNINTSLFPKSAFVGIMHIHSIDKFSNSVNPTIWATGPNCWYIDAVIKFKKPVPSYGKLGQWTPSESIHEELDKQITQSMYNIRYMDNIDFVKKSYIYYATQRGNYMKWIDVINSLKGDMDTFKYKLIQVLMNIKYKAYFWECDRVILNKPFRFVIFNSKTLAKRKQDDDAFEGMINCSRNVILFPSLSKDIHLVVPCLKCYSTDYTSLATFSRTAKIKQQYMFWKKVGQNIKENDWVSTSGLGVSWLHIRISKRPKYYHDLFVKYQRNSRSIMEEYIENFKFSKDFRNIIMISKGKIKEEYKDLITYYLELLPKDTTIISTNNKTIQEIVKVINLDTEIFTTNWKKHGRFGGFIRDNEMLKNSPNLITIFLIKDNKETHLIQQANKMGIPVLILYL